MSPPLYNSRIIDTYIRLIKSSRYKEKKVNITELLDSAGMKAYEVADQGHWFTQEQIDRFHEQAVRMTGNPHIARDAGRYAASPDAIGIMRQYVLGFVGPASAFEIISKVTANFTLSSTYKSREITANSVEIIVEPNEGVVEKPFQCENRIGFFEAIVMVYGHRPPRIEHSECIFKGAKSCRYTITWESSRSVLFKRAGVVLTFLFGIILLALLAVMPEMEHWTLLDILQYLFVAVVLLCALLVCALLVAISEKKELKASLENTVDSTDKLIDQINSNYNNAIMTNEIGKILSRCTNREEIVKQVVDIMEHWRDFERGLIFLANPERDKLIFEGGYGYSPEQHDRLNSKFFHLDRPDSKGVFVVSFNDKRPFLINDLNEIEDKLSPQSLEFVKEMGTRSFICCPIISEAQSVGLLAVDNVKTKRTLVESDISRLMGIASFIGISLRNAERIKAITELIEAKTELIEAKTKLIEDMERQFNSLLEVLAASIDARDTLTAGHSEKVTEYSVGICNQLDLPREEREMIRVASLLHDYGKIGVPDAILKKEGRLTPEEYEIVKTHAEKTKAILRKVTFEGIYARIPEIAGAHHEKVDGSGYPDGLTGEDIPLGARIIAVADYFEAITAKRHYRDPMPTNYALQLVREASGTLFDERVVEAFMTYLSETRQSDPAATDGQEQRSGIQQSPRIPNRVPVAVWLGEKAITAISEDISLHGVFVATDEEVRKGLPVELSIILGDNTPEVEAIGRVAWVNSRDALSKPSFPAGFGVEILEFSDMTERILESFLSSFVSAGYPQVNN